MKNLRILNPIALTLVAFACAGCDFAVQGSAALPDVTVYPDPVSHSDLDQLRYMQCYSDDLTVSFDLTFAQLSSLPSSMKLSGDITLKNLELYREVGAVDLGYADSGYAREVYAPGGYEISQSYERHGAYFNFKMRITNPDSFSGTAQIVTHEGGVIHTFQSTLDCYAR